MNIEELTSKLKRIRVEINTCIACAGELGFSTLETVEGIKKLTEARMWFGEALGKLGHKLPAEYRDEAMPRPCVISADEALRRYGATGLNELIRDGLIECTQNGYVLYPATPANAGIGEER